MTSGVSVWQNAVLVLPREIGSLEVKDQKRKKDVNILAKNIPDDKMKGRFKLLAARINRKFIVEASDYGSYKLKPCNCCIAGLTRAIEELKAGKKVVLQVFPPENGFHHINFYKPVVDHGR